MQQNLLPDEKKARSVAFQTSRLLQVILCVCVVGARTVVRAPTTHTRKITRSNLEV